MGTIPSDSFFLATIQLMHRGVHRTNESLGHGMPRSASDRRRWLGIDLPGPLEKRVEIDDHVWPIWKVWRTQACSAERPMPPAVAERLDPDETLVALRSK
jgi:hypothetical protein